MKLSIILLIISFTSISLKGLFPQTRTWKFYIKTINDGTFFLFKDLKVSFNSNVAISSCDLIYDNEKECENLIRIYMHDKSLQILSLLPPKNSGFITKISEKHKLLKSIFQKHKETIKIHINFELIILKLVKKFSQLFAPENN